MLLVLAGCGLFGSFTGDAPNTDAVGSDTGDTQTTEGDSGELDSDALAADDAAVRALTDIAQGDYPCRDPMLVRVTWVDDGDTVYVHPDDGSEGFKVRMIGLDTPEIAHEDSAAECYGDEASAFTSSELLDRLAWLGFDSDCTDPYDRALAYVIRGEGEEGFYNRRLVREGWARAYPIEPDTTYESEIASDERAAKAENAGMWGACQ
jgi:micrococcal nuclease